MGLFSRNRKEIKVEVCNDLDNKITESLRELTQSNLVNPDERCEIESWILKKKPLHKIPKSIQYRWIREMELYPIEIRFDFIKRMQKRLEYSCSDLVG